MTRPPSPESARAGSRHLHVVDDGVPIAGGAAWPLAILGAGLATGQVWGGLYRISIWGPVAIVAAVWLVGLVASRPDRLPVSGAVVLAALTGLAGLSAVSMVWAESAPEASLQAHRWALYAGLMAIVLLLVRDDRRRRSLIVGIGAAGALLVVAMTMILAFGEASRLFFVMRLTEPLGYVNGQAAALMFALWPAFALAERGRAAALRGAGATVTCLAGGLLLLTQSRGAMLGLIGALAFVLAAVPGRRRRTWLIVVVAAGLAVAAPSLLGVYGSTASQLGQPADDLVHRAVLLLLAGSLACGAAWSGATHLLDGERGSSQAARVAGRGGLVFVVTIAVGVGAVAIGDPVQKLREEVRQFKALEVSGLGQARLLAGGGNRHDYWRVAVEEFRGAPVLGVGAGNYPRDYFRLRRTQEDVRQPHSLELQALSELGLAGFGLVVTLLGALLWSCARAARGVRDGSVDGTIVVAGCGLIVSWIVQTSVDWLHLLPSLTGVMICAAGALTSVAARAPAQRRTATTIAAVCVTVLAAAGIGRLALADTLRSSARSTLASDPSEALRLTRNALRLQASDLPTLYVRAAAYARLDDYPDARQTLLDAARAEPHNFVPPALLGDLALRRGDLPEARARYRAALRLNPRDALLRAAYERVRAGDRG